MAEPADKKVINEEPQAQPQPEKLGAPEERKWPVKSEFTPEMLAEMEKLLPSKLNRVVATSLAGCIHCC